MTTYLRQFVIDCSGDAPVVTKRNRQAMNDVAKNYYGNLQPFLRDTSTQYCRALDIPEHGVFLFYHNNYGRISLYSRVDGTWITDILTQMPLVNGSGTLVVAFFPNPNDSTEVAAVLDIDRILVIRGLDTPNPTVDHTIRTYSDAQVAWVSESYVDPYTSGVGDPYRQTPGKYLFEQSWINSQTRPDQVGIWSADPHHPGHRVKQGGGYFNVWDAGGIANFSDRIAWAQVGSDYTDPNNREVYKVFVGAAENAAVTLSDATVDMVGVVPHYDPNNDPQSTVDYLNVDSFSLSGNANAGAFLWGGTMLSGDATTNGINQRYTVVVAKVSSRSYKVDGPRAEIVGLPTSLVDSSDPTKVIAPISSTFRNPTAPNATTPMTAAMQKVGTGVILDTADGDTSYLEYAYDGVTTVDLPWISATYPAFSPPEGQWLDSIDVTIQVWMDNDVTYGGYPTPNIYGHFLGADGNLETRSHLYSELSEYSNDEYSSGVWPTPLNSGTTLPTGATAGQWSTVTYRMGLSQDCADAIALGKFALSYHFAYGAAGNPFTVRLSSMTFTPNYVGAPA